MKVVFCFHTHDHEYNFGIAFLDAALRKYGIETDLVIYREIPHKHKDTAEEIVERLLEKKPSIIAFSIMTFNWARIKQVISLLRPRFKGLIIAGGYHTILCPDEVLDFNGVDAVCLGEGEKPLLALIKHYLKNPFKKPPKIQGMLFKDSLNDSQKCRTPWLMESLDEFPFMDYEIFRQEGQHPLNEKFIGTLSLAGIFSLSVITGRGCPFHCTYCNNSSLMKIYGGVKHYVRRLPAKKAVSYIKTIANKYQPDFLEFLDETFTMDKSWVKNFCDDYRQKVRLPFSIMTRIDRLDEEIVSIMANSGLKVVFFGLECGDEEYRAKFLNRHMSNKLIKKGAQILKKYQVMIVTFNMFGMPFETKETINQTMKLNDAIKPEAAIAFIYQPLPHTKLAEIAYEHNMALPPSEEHWDFCSPALDSPELPASYITQQVELFKERFASPAKIEQFYKKIRTIVEQSE